jgi:ankyrin repeat protein
MSRQGKIDRFANAVEAGDLEIVQEMVCAEPQLIFEHVWYTDQALHLACWQKHLQIIKFLLERGVDVNAHGDLGRTPLHYALYEGDNASTEIAATLISAGADVNALDNLGSTPLDYAASEVNDELKPCISLLLERGARMTPFAGTMLTSEEEFASVLEQDSGTTSMRALQELAQLAQATGRLGHLTLILRELARRSPEDR